MPIIHSFDLVDSSGQTLETAELDSPLDIAAFSEALVDRFDQDGSDFSLDEDLGYHSDWTFGSALTSQLANLDAAGAKKLVNTYLRTADDYGMIEDAAEEKPLITETIQQLIQLSGQCKDDQQLIGRVSD